MQRTSQICVCSSSTEKNEEADAVDIGDSGRTLTKGVGEGIKAGNYQGSKEERSVDDPIAPQDNISSFQDKPLQ